MYQQGTASTTAALLQSLATFASSAGWTVDESDASSGYDWVLAIHKGSSYILLCATGLNILVYGSTGYTKGASPSAQPGVSPAATINFFSAPFTGTYFFSDPDQTYLHVIVQVTSGVFAHIHIGALTSIGGAPTATYGQVTQWAMNNQPNWANVDAQNNCIPWSNYSYYNGFLGTALDGANVWYRAQGIAPARLIFPLQPGGFQQRGVMYSPSTFNALSPLFPIPVYCERASVGIYTPVGVAPDIRLVNMAYYNPLDEITIGSDIWKVFPAVAKGPTTNVYKAAAPSSGNYGYAFRKVA